MNNQDKEVRQFTRETLPPRVFQELNIPAEDRGAVRSVIIAYFRGVSDPSQFYPWTMDRFLFTVGQTIGNRRWYQKLCPKEREKFISQLRELVESFYPTARDIIEECYCDDDEPLLFADGFDDAIIGIARRFEQGGQKTFVLYDQKKVVEIFARSCRENDDGSDLTFEELTGAEEYFEFNVVGSYVGPCTPAYVVRAEDIIH